MLAKMYKKVAPLVKKEVIKVSQLKDYKHTKEITSSILSYDEVAQACKFYPIYFAKDTNGIIPMAILGLEDKNDFLDSKGQWDSNMYIPAVFRAYPLGMAKTEEKNENYTLVYDSDYSGINKKDGKEMTTKDGLLTDFGQNAVDFLQNLQGNINTTQKALKVLEEYELLRFADIDITMGDKEYKVAKVGIIDEEVLNNLSDDKIVHLVKQGVYRLIDMHFLSTSNINTLIDKLKK